MKPAGQVTPSPNPNERRATRHRRRLMLDVGPLAQVPEVGPHVENVR
jgi:hypothetical protein